MSISTISMTQLVDDMNQYPFLLVSLKLVIGALKLKKKRFDHTFVDHYDFYISLKKFGDSKDFGEYFKNNLKLHGS